VADELLELSGAVQDALSWLKSAEEILGRLTTDEQTGTPVGWSEAEQAANRVGNAVLAVQTCLVPLARAIEEAKRRDQEDDREPIHPADYRYYERPRDKE
jgi:hypothetical protein